MVDLIDLPDLILLLIISKLPIWKLPCIELLCRRLWQLVQTDYKKRHQLRLFGGIYCNKFDFPECSAVRIIDLPVQYDLVVRFEGRHRMDREHFNYTLTADLEVQNVAKMTASLRNITHLTVVLANRFPEGFVIQLLRAWPKMQSLKIYNHTATEMFLDWQQIAYAIREMPKLEHFMFYGSSVEYSVNRDFFDDFTLSGKLKTFISSDYPKYKMIRRDGRDSAVVVDRDVWNKPKFALAIEKFETVGVYTYTISPNSDFTNVELLRKMKRVEVRDCAYLDTLRQMNLTNWTALQFMTLGIEQVSFSQLFATLSGLTNLVELNLVVDKVELPKARACRRWTRLPAVRRFRLMAHLDAHQFHKVANCVPNATECSLQLWTTINVENQGPEAYFKQRRTLQGIINLCKECEAVMKRAIEKYRSDINAFVWFRQVGEDGNVSMVPKVRLFTEQVAGTTRFNTQFIPIY